MCENEEMSVMVNEEEDIGMEWLLGGLEVGNGLKGGKEIDEWIEEEVDYGFCEKGG